MSDFRQHRAYPPCDDARVLLDPDVCYERLHGRDPRFDGWFYVAVTSTGIYCRPSCPAMVPKRRNVRFYPTAAAAQTAGFRACKRCRPDAVPGSPEWNNRADVVARAMRLIADGEVDRSGVEGLASRLGYSSRHLNRLLVDEVGAGPLALARAQRATAARTLVQTSDLPFAEVAFASGFASIRQFNDTVRAVFAATPTEMRRAARKGRGAEPTGAGFLALRLSHRSPLDSAHLFGFLARRAVPGVESGTEFGYQRTLRLPHGPAVVELRPAVGHVACQLRLADWRDLTSAVARCRRLLDLDADPEAVDAFLAPDPIVGESVRKWPGRRVPGHVDGAEVVTRAVLGQQVSVTAAARLAGWLAAEHGEALARAGRSAHPALPDARHHRRARPRVVPDAPIALPCGGGGGRGGGRRPGGARRGGRSRRRRRRSPGDPGHRPLDGGLRGDAGPRRRRRVPARRHGRPCRARRRRCAVRPPLRRGHVPALAPLAGLRPAAPLGPRASAADPPSDPPHKPRSTPMSHRYDVIDSPVGPLLAACDDTGVTDLRFDLDGAGHDPASGWTHDPPALAGVRSQLDEYFAGTRTDFDLPLSLHGTDFQRRVWLELTRIPYGETISYGELARRIGRPTAMRAVGLANGRNPVSIIVPCHRVIGADGSLTGYGGGLDRKRLLLGLESDDALTLFG